MVTKRMVVARKLGYRKIALKTAEMVILIDFILTGY